jgi:uncharacterized protein
VVSAFAGSALYTGHVRHHRLAPAHAFRYRIVMCLLDLDEVEEVMDRHPLWSTRPRRPIQFRRGDYLGDPAVDLKVAARRQAEGVLGPIPEGPVRLLTQVRTWGWGFNPISIYYCVDRANELAAAVASVTNTPWGERHNYVLKAADGQIDESLPKSLHVSPFLTMEHTYHFVLSAPGEQLDVRVDVLEGDEVRVGTALHLTRSNLDRRAMTALLASPPFMAWRVSAAIYWQAALLRRKGAPFRPHPRCSSKPAKPRL